MTKLNIPETSEQHTVRIRHLLQESESALKAGRQKPLRSLPEITFTRSSSTAGPALDGDSPAGGPAGPAPGDNADAKLKVAQEDLDKLMAESGLCEWVEDKDGDWKAACGQGFTLFNGAPEENHYRYCPNCGKKIVAKPVDVFDEEDS